MRISLTTEQRINLTKLCNALESGEYEQGNNALHSNGRFCCLGVACEISGLGKWGHIDGGPEAYCVNSEFDRATLTMLPTIQLYYGICADGWRGGDGLKQSDLVNMNDSGKSFVEIAKHIRKYIMEH